MKTEPTDQTPETKKPRKVLVVDDDGNGELSRFVKQLARLSLEENSLEVHRWDELARRYEMVAEAGLAQWQESLRGAVTQFGGGRYWIVARDPNSGQILAQLTRVYSKAAFPGAHVPPAAAARPAAASAPEGSDLVRMLADQQRSFLDALERSQRSLAESFASALAPLTKSPAASLKETMEMMRELSPESKAERQLGVLQKALETVAATAKPAAAGDNDTVQTIVAGGVMDILKSFVEPGNPNSLSNLIKEVKGGESAPAAEAKAKTNGASGQLAKIKNSSLYTHYAGEILRLAKSQADPEQAALAIVQEIPRSFRGMALGYIKSPDLVATVLQLEPEAAEHQDWIAAVQRKLAAILETPKTKRPAKAK